MPRGLSGHNFGHTTHRAILVESGDLLLRTTRSEVRDGERGRNRTYNLLIKSQSSGVFHLLISHSLSTSYQVAVSRCAVKCAVTQSGYVLGSTAVS